jgi:Flp pilus assembly pilin Flp
MRVNKETELVNVSNRLRPEKGEKTSMELCTKMYVNASERMRKSIRKNAEGQTMTEYALILAAVAIVAYVTYQVMGQDIGSMVNKIDSALSTA